MLIRQTVLHSPIARDEQVKRAFSVPVVSAKAYITPPNSVVLVSM